LPHTLDALLVFSPRSTFHNIHLLNNHGLFYFCCFGCFSWTCLGRERAITFQLVCRPLAFGNIQGGLKPASQIHHLQTGSRHAVRKAEPEQRAKQRLSSRWRKPFLAHPLRWCTSTSLKRAWPHQFHLSMNDVNQDGHGWMRGEHTPPKNACMAGLQ